MINFKHELNKLLTRTHQYMIVTVDAKDKPVYLEVDKSDGWFMPYKFSAQALHAKRSDLDSFIVWNSKRPAERQLAWLKKALAEHLAQHTTFSIPGVTLNTRSLNTLKLIRLETTCCFADTLPTKSRKSDVLAALYEAQATAWPLAIKEPK